METLKEKQGFGYCQKATSFWCLFFISIGNGPYSTHFAKMEAVEKKHFTLPKQ